MATGPAEHDCCCKDSEITLDGEHSNDELINDSFLKQNHFEIFKIVISAVLFSICVILNFSEKTKMILYLLSYAIAGYDVIIGAVKNIIRGSLFDETFLMSIATLGAAAIGEYPEAAAVILFYKVGELLQESAVSRSRKSIKALLKIYPEFANKICGDEVIKLPPDKIAIGDSVLIRAGEKIPLDGEVLFGESFVDTSSLTGESIPKRVAQGDTVYAGCINGEGVLTVRVTKCFGDSAISKILELVENAQSQKAPTEKFITRFAKGYTPAVVGLATIIAVIPPLIAGIGWGMWFHRALVFLVASCPCALLLSIPLGFFGGIGGASKRGILVKGGNFLETMEKLDTVVFDKTGTLTLGVFEVVEVYTMGKYGKEDVLEYAAIAERHSMHPVGKSIIKAWGDKEATRFSEQNLQDAANYSEFAGKGVKCVSGEQTILAGNIAFLVEQGILTDAQIISDAQINSNTKVFVAVGGEYIGSIAIADRLKSESAATVKELKQLGIKRVVMLTGDNEETASIIAKEAGIDEYYANLLPHQKVEKFEEMKNRNTKAKIAFVGDGINDAPVLALADAGIAMGGLGSDAAIEASDIVIMNDDISKIAMAIKVARRTGRIVRQNIAFALAVKALVLVLGAGGIATMWEAVFADVGVTIVAVANAMRAIRRSY